ncbi:coiled-coil domain-containing protein 173 [Polypterus senegalus]|nr:coiled-coil domain-containing protein 173 [Polypterus senegalus]
MAAVEVVQYGRRKGRSRESTPTQMLTQQHVPVDFHDLQQVTILPKAEWQRIQENINKVNREAEWLQQVRCEKESLHERSKEVVKNWSNTIAGQRQKKLEEKRIWEEQEEEERRKLDLEEAQLKAAKRKEAIEQAKTLQYYQTDRVKGFHSALLLSEVIKERDAQVELKQKKLNAMKNIDSDILGRMQREREEAIYEDQQKALKRFLDQKATSEAQMEQIKAKQQAKEKDTLEDQKEAEAIKLQTRLYEWEQSKLKQLKDEEKKQLMESHKEHISNKELMKAIEKQKQDEEQKMIQLFSEAKQKMTKLRKEKEAELFREKQEQQDQMTDLLAAQIQQKQFNDDEIIAKAVAEQKEKFEKEVKEKEAKRTEELKLISEHRYRTVKEKEEKKKQEKLQALEALYTKKESDREFLSKQWEKEHKVKMENKNLQDVLIHQMAEKQEQSRRQRVQQLEYDKQNAALNIAEEKQFQEYANEMIEASKRAERNVYALHKAARGGIGGGLGPVVGGLRPSYLTQDNVGVQLPNYNRTSTQDIKLLHDTGNIQQSKKRLGFTW